MTTTANIPVTNFSAMIPALTNDGPVLAWLWPAHVLHTLEKLSPFQRAVRTCVEHMQCMDTLYQERPGGFGYFGQLHQIKIATSTKKGPSAEKVFHDPAFERMWENMSEFGRAGKAATLMREIFRDLTVYAKDSKLQSRLFTVLRRVVTSDSTHKRGERTVVHGDHRRLKGFNFNARAALRTSLYARCAVTIDRAAGTATVAIPSFVPKVMVRGTRGTSHFRIVAGVAAVNFETEGYSYQRGATGDLPWDHVPTAASNLVLNFPADSPDTILLALGVEYKQAVNGEMYPLKSRQVNATSIVAVNKP